ncbi:MAG: hypothetical protein ACKV22_30470 [Bryobacteraceae bacterium]
MRSLLILVALATLTTPGCKKRDRIRVGQTEEGAVGPASVVHVADTRTEKQLLAGFHSVEQNSWRWTEGRFSVALKPPAGAAQRGAVLEMRFSVSEPVIKKLQTMSLTAKVNGTPLPPETYTQPGEMVFARDLEPALLARDTVKVDFELDRFAKAGEFDSRELGLIVASIGLEAK